MELLITAAATAWVLCWFAVVGLAVPAVALGAAEGETSVAREMGPALVWAWLAIAIATPLAASVRGFNWLTALLIAVSFPLLLWLYRHRGAYQTAFNRVVQQLVFRVVSPRLRMREKAGRGWSAATVAMAAFPLLAVWRLFPGRADLRLPMPSEFDTLWRTRQLLAGTTAWDPLAALTAVLTRVSSSDALTASGALRIALIVLTVIAVGCLVAETARRWWAGAATAGVLLAAAPYAPASLWVLALAASIGLTSLGRWIRDERARDGWHAVAAGVLLLGQFAPFADTPGLLFTVSRTPQYLESSASSREAGRLARSEPGVDWLLVAPPEQRLAFEGERRSYDLARFVSRFQDRAGQTGFRFDVPARRLFVFVDKRPAETGAAAHVQFISAQLPAYRVPRERARLQRQAMRLCDDYRRTHAGASVVYDDDELRVYRFDV